MREQIIAAAKDCDAEGLAELAGADLVHDVMHRSPGVDVLTTFIEDVHSGGCGYHRYPNQVLSCEPLVFALLRALDTAPVEGVVRLDLEGWAEYLDKPVERFSGFIWDDPDSEWDVGITPDGDWRFFATR
jgi:hypothetical protein